MDLCCSPISLTFGRVRGARGLHSCRGCAAAPRWEASISGIYTAVCRTAKSKTFPLFLSEAKPRVVYNTMSYLKSERFYFYNLPPGLQIVLGEFNCRKRLEIMPKELNRIFYCQISFKVILSEKGNYRKCMACYFYKN